MIELKGEEDGELRLLWSGYITRVHKYKTDAGEWRTVISYRDEFNFRVRNSIEEIALLINTANSQYN